MKTTTYFAVQKKSTSEKCRSDLLMSRSSTVEILENDIITSVRDVLQFIAMYHPRDFRIHLSAAYQREESTAAKDAIAQTLVNSRMAALGHRAMCQDAGVVVVFAKVGQEVHIASERLLGDLINEGVRLAYADVVNPLRASMVSGPLFARRNKDNTPVSLHVELVRGNKIQLGIAAKGGGSENKARFTILDPSASVSDWVVETVRTLGGGWCPLGTIAVGVSGSADKAMRLAKEALLKPINMTGLIQRGPATPEEQMRVELYDRINRLGVGAQGLGGLTTVLDIKIVTYPTHAASKPVALIPQCVANRHATVVLDGTGPALLDPPQLADWPELALEKMRTVARRVNLDNLTCEEMACWQAGDVLLLSGKLLTGRDAAHRRIAQMVRGNEPVPVSFKNRVIYYVGPVDPVRSEIVGPAGPTTSSRMDSFADLMLDQGLPTMIGKAERGGEAVNSMARRRAAILVSKTIKSATLLAFADLGMEAIYEFCVEDMSVTVAVDSSGASIHVIGLRCVARSSSACRHETSRFKLITTVTDAFKLAA
jgi:fumarate hydratase class I